LVALGALVVIAEEAPAIRWPFEPQESPHAVYMTYGQHDWGWYEGRPANLFHPGLDIPKPAGEPVLAGEPGWVIYSSEFRAPVQRCGLIVGSRATSTGFAYGHLDWKSIPERFTQPGGDTVMYTGEFLGKVARWPSYRDPDHLEFSRVKVSEDPKPPYRKSWIAIGNAFLHLNPDTDSQQPFLDKVRYPTNEPEA